MDTILPAGKPQQTTQQSQAAIPQDPWEMRVYFPERQSVAVDGTVRTHSVQGVTRFVPAGGDGGNGTHSIITARVGKKGSSNTVTATAQMQGEREINPSTLFVSQPHSPTSRGIAEELIRQCSGFIRGDIEGRRQIASLHAPKPSPSSSLLERHLAARAAKTGLLNK